MLEKQQGCPTATVVGNGFGEVAGGQIIEGLNKGFGFSSKCGGKLLENWEQGRELICPWFPKIDPHPVLGQRMFQSLPIVTSVWFAI